jgi:hypothetical protein
MPDIYAGDGMRIAPAVLLPVGANTGSYSKGMASGVIAAGLGAGSIVYSFRFAPASSSQTKLALVRRVLVSAAVGATGFTAGSGRLDLFAARPTPANSPPNAWVDPTGGTSATLTGDNANLRTSFPATSVGGIVIASTGALTQSVSNPPTLDTDPLASMQLACGGTAGTVMAAGGSVLFGQKTAEYPLVLAVNEGFQIKATVPATGVWGLSVNVDWDEVPAW